MTPFDDTPEGQTNYCPLCEHAGQENATLRTMLKRLEFLGDGNGVCPVCRQFKHAPGCELAKLIHGEVLSGD